MPLIVFLPYRSQYILIGAGQVSDSRRNIILGLLALSFHAVASSCAYVRFSIGKSTTSSLSRQSLMLSRKSLTMSDE